MRIRILESISGIYGSFAAGEETDWPDDKDAANLVKAGVAEKVGPAKKTKVEKATSRKVAETVHEIDDQLDDMAEWQEKHQEFHDRAARTPR